MKTKNLIILLLMSITTQAQQFVGDWKGELDVQGMKLEIIFHIAQKDNVYTSTMDVPMQGASGVAIDKTEVNNNAITLKAQQMGIEFGGAFKNGQIVGEFRQGGMNLPLTLSSFENKLPGNTALPSSKQELDMLKAYDKGNFNYSVSDYFAKPKASGFQLSPNGKYMSYREKDENNKRHVYVKELATGNIKKVIEEKEELLRGYGWINDERLFFSMDKGGDENYHIYGVNIDGNNLKDLTPFDGVQASIDNILKEQKDYIIVSMNKNNKQVFEPFKLNIVTGELVQLYKNEDVANPIQGYEFDKDGNLRGFSKLANGVQNEMYYKDNKTGEFNLLLTTNWDDTFSIMLRKTKTKPTF
jgi:hypothetical protein